MKFRATVELGGKTATGIEVPEQLVEELGSGKRPRVRVTINGYTYRSTVAPTGGVFMLPVSAEVRERSGVAAGDIVEVEVQLDTEPREVTLPPDFAAALDGDANAKQFFDGLSYSNKQRVVLAIEGAKTSETRQRRIATTVSKLHTGQTQRRLRHTRPHHICERDGASKGAPFWFPLTSALHRQARHGWRLCGFHMQLHGKE